MRRIAAFQRAQQLRLVQPAEPSRVVPECVEVEPVPEMLLFRAQTSALLHHFLEICSQVGRVPSILGREFFRSKVTHHRVPSFEDQALFMYDVERCLGKLPSRYSQVLAMAGLHNLPIDEVAARLGMSRSWVNRQYVEGLDFLSQIFLNAGVLSYRRPDRKPWQTIRGDELETEAVVAGGAKKPCGSVRFDSSCHAVQQRAVAQRKCRPGDRLIVH